MFSAKNITMILFALLIGFSAHAAVYQMNGNVTYLWDYDVDYYAPPISLARTANTAAVHRIDFYVNSYREYCVYWQQRCTRYDGHGRCIQWENVCARWDYQVTKVPKSIYLDFRTAHPIPAGTQEGYQINIDRRKPTYNGEDWVYTWLRVHVPYKPEKITKRGEYNYSIFAQ